MADISPIAQIIDDVKATSGNGTLFAVFVMALLWIWLKDEERENHIRIVYPTMLYLAFLLNPLVMKFVLTPIFYSTPEWGGVMTVRMYVALPVVPVIAYFFTRILLHADNRRKQVKTGVALLILLLLTGGFVLRDNNFRIPANKVQIRDDVVQMNEAILADGQEAKAVIPDELAYCFRNYNANMKIFSSRGYSNIPEKGAEYTAALGIEEAMLQMWPDIKYICETGREFGVTVFVFDTEYHGFSESPANYGYDYFGNFGQYDVYKLNAELL